MEQTIPFKRLADIRNYSAAFAQMGDDYIFSRINKASEQYVAEHQPIRVSGVSICLLLKGSLTIEINSKEYHLRPVSLFTFSSNSVLNIKNINWDEIDAYVLFLSSQFMQGININLNTINFSMIGMETSPVIDKLSENEIGMLRAYMDLLNSNANINIETAYSKNAARSLIQAMLYQLMQIKDGHSKQPDETSDPAQNRRLNYVHDFLRLVQIYHTQERSLTFYADKLFISPKYLSRIIKENTGRSAADWIDQFVVLEAKNLLRFSNKNIQQVAYALNFPTQSSFGKFFKHITGMSPSQYQKT